METSLRSVFVIDSAVFVPFFCCLKEREESILEHKGHLIQLLKFQWLN